MVISTVGRQSNMFTGNKLKILYLSASYKTKLYLCRPMISVEKTSKNQSMTTCLQCLF